MSTKPTRFDMSLMALAVAGSLVLPSICSAESGQVSHTIKVPAVAVSEHERGQRIEADGFGVIGEPGKPILPGRIFAIAVPPGADVISVSWEARDPVALESVCSLPPTPLARVIGSEDPEIYQTRLAEWQAIVDEAYGTDDPYPAEPVTLVGTGGFRGFDVVDVRVAPCRYRAVSGRVECFQSIDVVVEYDLQPDNLERRYDWIPELEPTAREIIANFDEARRWYHDPQHESGQTTDGFLIITTADLVDSVAPLAAHERAKGRNTTVATVEWINSQYQGVDLAARMRRFLRDVYPSSQWGIRNLLMVGDRYRVPMRLTCVDIGYGRPYTDFYFAELSLDDQDSWDLNGDNCFGEYGADQVDFYSEIDVGRIPWSDPDTVRQICEKSAAYELNQDPAFKRNILVMGSFFWENTDTAVLMEAKLAQPWMADWTVTRMYEDNETVQTSFPYDETLEWGHALSAMAQGRYAFINWAGHGSPESAHTMGNYGAAFVNLSTCPLLDDDYPAIIWADSCSTAEPSQTSLAREMIGQGAVGYVGATKVAYGAPEWTGPWSGSSQSCDYFFTTKVTSGEMTQGRAHQWSMNHLYVNGLWADPRYEIFEWTLHGNPDLGMGPIETIGLLIDGFESGGTGAWSSYPE
jgi:hypothetical protein